MLWGQLNNIHINRICKLQNKAIRVINFAGYHDPVEKLYKNSKILKFKDNLILNNYLYVHDNLNRRLPSALLDKFKYRSQVHQHETRIAVHKCISLPKSRTVAYGIHSVEGMASRDWNRLQVLLSSHNLHLQSRSSCKKHILKHFIDSY